MSKSVAKCHFRRMVGHVAYAAFVLPPLSSTLTLACNTSKYTYASLRQWKSPFRVPFSKLPRSLQPNTGIAGNQGQGVSGSSGSSGTGSGGNNASVPDLDRSLFASNAELEQLALRSTDAPILTRVVSYNVLSSSLSGASHFPECDSTNLNSATRLKRVLTKLEGPVAARSIICLQEVSLSWSGHLHAFFANRGFHLMFASHGSYFNGYMGEALAFPLDLFEAIELRIERLTDMMSWPSRPKASGLSGFTQMACLRLRKAWHALLGSPQPPRKAARDPWEHARGRFNRFIFARLRSRTNGAKLCVATYHMPCIYWSPPVMMIHSALLVRSFQRLCGGDDGVLAGDFNVKPTDVTYDMIIRGTVDKSHEDYPPSCPDGSPADKWFPTPLAPMKSAYREVLGEEPDFTNYAKVENQPVFIETLDYVFCTQGVDIVDVIRLPNRDVIKGPFPDASEPSDHVMIGATLRLPAPNRHPLNPEPEQSSE